jgi:hypothetical protein
MNLVIINSSNYIHYVAHNEYNGTFNSMTVLTVYTFWDVHLS